MQHLIKEDRLRDDAWILIDEETEPPEAGPVILPLVVYREDRDDWQSTDRPVAVWLNDDQMAEDVADLLDEVALVALRFAKFADGRGFSKARLLRDRYHYSGEIRAVGDFLPDQVFYMRRCGIDAFACRSTSEAETALSLLEPFSVRYQGDTDHGPLFQQR